jgi:hypothetical protein
MSSVFIHEDRNLVAFKASFPCEVLLRSEKKFPLEKVFGPAKRPHRRAKVHNFHTRGTVEILGLFAPKHGESKKEETHACADQ